MKPQILNSKMKQLILRNRIVKFAVFIGLALTVVMMTGSQYFKTEVFVTDNGVTREFKTNETDVYAILASENYELGINDRVTYTEDKHNVSHIEIFRAFDVNINADGRSFTKSYTEGTVGDALKNADITIYSNDMVNHSLSEKLFAGIDITVTRIKYIDNTETVTIPFETEYVDNSNLTIGTEKVLTEGRNGIETTTTRDKYVDGKLVSSSVIERETTQQVRNRVIERGTASATPYAKMDDPTALKLVNGIPQSYTRVISGKSTAYSAYSGAGTASGRRARVGTVAVNPNVIPYGSELYIASPDGSIVYGYAIAADTGTALMDGRTDIDLFMASYDDSCSWGAVYVNIYVLSEGNG